MTVNKPMPEQQLALINKLADQAFHSGDQLASEFAVTRAAISKWVAHLNQSGIDVLSVKGRGYQLSAQVQPYQLATIERELSQELAIDYQALTGSTNDNVKQTFAQQTELQQPILSFCEQQSAGRGRRGRQWISPFAQNLYFSLGIELDMPVSQLSGLSLAVGFSLANSLRELDIPVQLKWPNDLYLDGVKLGGILVELDGAFDSPCRVVIGVGLNTNMQQSKQQIDQAWTSLAQFAGQTYNRTDLLISLTRNLLADLTLFAQHGLKPWLALWPKLDAFYQQQVSLMMPNKQIDGIEQGIAEDGALLIETKDGLTRFVGGEISVRKRA